MVGVGSFALIISSLVVLLYRADVPADMDDEPSDGQVAGTSETGA
jgi:hypothetical protein